MKIVINKCFGGFSLSVEATKLINERKNRPCYAFTQNDGIDGPYTLFTDPDKDSWFTRYFDDPTPPHPMPDEWYEAHSVDLSDIDRTDADLIHVVETIGSARASGWAAKLAVIEIPDGVDWELDEYDGRESVHEKHRSWS